MAVRSCSGCFVAVATTSEKKLGRNFDVLLKKRCKTFV